MIQSDTLEEKVAFDRFSDLMAKLMVKYGPDVLKRRKEQLLEAILSSIDFAMKQSPKETLSRITAYHKAVENSRKQ